MKLACSAILLALIAPIALGAQDLRVPVNIQIGAPDAPFVDPSLKDSAKDLAGYLRDRKIARLVEQPKDAIVIVRIVNRFTQEGGSIITVPMPNMAMAIPYQDTTLQVALEVGEFTHGLSAAGDGSWRMAARRMSQQIERWLKENQNRLLGAPR